MLAVNSGDYAVGSETATMTTVGKRIKTLREAAGLSQPALAKMVGIKQPSLSNIERDETEKLRGDTLAGLCKALGVSPAQILEGAPAEDAASLTHEAEIVAIWRALTADDRDHLIVVARALRDRMVAKPVRPAAPAMESDDQPMTARRKPDARRRA